jgi:hypothetical protein
MKKKFHQILFRMIIPFMYIIVMFFHPTIIRADDTFTAYCHKKTGECFYEEDVATSQTWKKLIKQFGTNDIELYWMDVKPCDKVWKKRSEDRTEEERNMNFPVNEAIVCGMFTTKGIIGKGELKWKLFKTTEEYSSGAKKAEYTGYGLGQYLIEIKHGKMTEWYENGQKKAEIIFEFGSKKGKGTIWYDSGAIMHKLNFLNDKPHGVVRTYYENGALCYKDTYKYGEKTNRKAYDEEGRLKFDQDY